MENRDARLFRVAYTSNSLVLLLFFTGVTSLPATRSIIVDVMKKDTRLCNTSKFLYESEYMKPCASLEYPSSAFEYRQETLDEFLCVGVYDTAFKICQYSNLLQTFNSTAVFNSYVKKFIPEELVSEDEDQEETFCKDKLQGFTAGYNKTELLLGPLVKGLNTPHKCVKICFDIDDKFHSLCAVLAWIKSIDDLVVKKQNETGTKHNSGPSDVKSQINDQQLDNLGKTDKTKQATILQDNKASDTKTHVSDNITLETVEEVKETKKQNATPKDDGHEEGNTNLKKNELNATVYISPEHERMASEKQASDQAIQQEDAKIVSENSGPQAIQQENTKIVSENSSPQVIQQENTKIVSENAGPQAPPANNAAGNVPNEGVANEGNVEEFDKKQDVDDLKTSTLSENTQDHYDAGNPEDDVESNIGDNINGVDNTIQQPIDAGSQNGNLQEPFEQKTKLRYSPTRNEDDSHFFTYFTVITVACIAGYIGYHNKQKILAIVLEGRRSRSNRGRRRPSTASYRKLDCTLEEAVTSQCNANVTHVIY